MLRHLYSQMRTFVDWIGAGERARLRKVLSWLFLIGVFLYLIAQLHEIGWAEIWATRPSSPLFYMFVLLGYLTLPLADTLIYRRMWNTRAGETLAACLRKRIYNSAFVGYSGEVFLLLWARTRAKRSSVQLAHEIKDSSILSALVSNYVTAALLLYLLMMGGFRHMPLFNGWALLTLAMAVLTPIAFLFRDRFMVLSARDAGAVLGIHAVRFFIVQGFILGQWYVEMPEIDLAALVSLLAVQMLVSRIPVLPNRDLLFVSIGIAVSGSLALPQAKIASLLVTTTALQQALHLLMTLLTSIKLPSRDRGEPASTGVGTD